MLIPDLSSHQPMLIGDSPAGSSRAVSSNADAVRYLSDLWQNLEAIQALLAADRAETPG